MHQNTQKTNLGISLNQRGLTKTEGITQNSIFMSIHQGKKKKKKIIHGHFRRLPLTWEGIKLTIIKETIENNHTYPKKMHRNYIVLNYPKNTKRKSSKRIECCRIILKKVKESTNGLWCEKNG